MRKLSLPDLINVAFVTEFANTRLQIEGVIGLYDDMQKKWDGLKDIQGRNLVVGVRLAGTKTDACKSYATELITRYMGTIGMTMQNWSFESLRSQSRDSEGGLAAIGVQDYRHHQDLFKWTMSFVIGIDPLLIDAAFALKDEDHKLSTRYLLYWLLNKHKYISTNTDFVLGRKVDLSQIDDNWPLLLHNATLIRRENIPVILEHMIDMVQSDSPYADPERDDFLTAILARAITEPTVVVIGKDEDPIKVITEAREDFLKS